MSAKLTLEDISDLRAYERERPEFRTHVSALKRCRRIALGPVVTVLFENRDTVRFQIQEMARVEKLTTDEAIQIELDTYNPLIPQPGWLCATLFLELTTDAEVREWLPKLVGIERSIVLRTAGGTEIRSSPEAQHETQLTRDTATTAVHYLVFPCSPEQVAALVHGPVTLGCDHRAYPQVVELSAATLAELVGDLAS